jgi:hypothetical protein
VVEHFGVGRRIASWCAADRGLVDIDDFVEVLQPLDGVDIPDAAVSEEHVTGDRWQ